MKLFLFANDPELVLVERYENEFCDEGEKWLYAAQEQALTFLQKVRLIKNGCKGYYHVDTCVSTDKIISAIIEQERYTDS